jgi:hypothetical protein
VWVNGKLSLALEGSGRELLDDTRMAQLYLGGAANVSRA